MENYELVLSIICALIASSGFWAFISKRSDHGDYKTALLIGLAHDKIMELGMKYIERGSITQDEYENLYEYLFIPYEKLGGNGSAKRIMKEVDKLRIVPGSYVPDSTHE